MKLIPTALVALFLSASASAMRIACVTEFPTTSVVSEMDGDDLVVHVFHHNGVKFMPLYTGVITPNDLPMLAEKAETFGKIGNHYELRWDVSNCKRDDQDIMSCIRGKETEIEGVKVKPWGIFTKRIHSEFEDQGSYDQIEVSFMMDVDDKAANFSMVYSKDECDQTEAKSKALLSKIKTAKK